MGQVNGIKNIYNTSPTPSPPPTPTVKTPPSSGPTSSIASPSSGFSISSFCRKIVSWIQSGWKWLKENILRIKPEKPEPIQSSPVPSTNSTKPPSVDDVD